MKLSASEPQGLAALKRGSTFPRRDVRLEALYPGGAGTRGTQRTGRHGQGRFSQPTVPANNSTFQQTCRSSTTSWCEKAAPGFPNVRNQTVGIVKRGSQIEMLFLTLKCYIYKQALEVNSLYSRGSWLSPEIHRGSRMVPGFGETDTDTTVGGLPSDEHKTV